MRLGYFLGGGEGGARVVETYQEMRVLAHTCVMTCGGQRAAGAGCSWSSGLFGVAVALGDPLGVVGEDG